MIFGRRTRAKVAPLVQQLPDGPIDIVGDVHGEHRALVSLLNHLGYAPSGEHIEGRYLVFLGDLVDRGPDSPAVIKMVRRLVDNGRATCLLGNHEFNLIRKQRKQGNGWFYGDIEVFGGRLQGCFPSVRLTTERARRDALKLFDRMPVVLERDDLRIVHAAWHEESVELARCGSRDVFLRRALDGPLRDDPRQLRYEERRRRLANYGAGPPPFDEEIAQLQLDKQDASPISCLLNGPEAMVPTREPFYAGGMWRFVERQPWWEDYVGPPVVVGHYWRKRTQGLMADGLPDASPSGWWGRGNVYCLDYSVGRRYFERARGTVAGFDGHLAAMRWPEREVIFDDGQVVQLDEPGKR